MPKVSICIPAYNQTQYLKKTLQSILIQSYQDYEVIITDDTPSTLISDLIREYDFKGKLKYYHNVSPLGSPQNWNFCISKAQGEYIKILHHDDWFTSHDSLAKFVKIFDDNPQIVFAFSSSQALYEDEKKNFTHTIIDEQLFEIQSNPFLLFLGNKIGGPSAIIFRKESGIFFDQKLKWLVDIDFYISSLVKYNEVKYISDTLITTFAAEDRISNFCYDNKIVEVFEHFYLYEKIASIYSKYKAYSLNKCFIHLSSICDKYDITKISDIRDCGYIGKIHLSVRIYLLLKNVFGQFFIKKAILSVSRLGYLR